MNNILYNKTLSVTLIIMALITVFSSSSYARNNLKGDMVLWYDQPAKAWLDANQIGNGFMGGVVFGKTGNERIALNEGTFWIGLPHDYNDPNAGSHFEYIKEQVFAGKYEEITGYLDRNFWGKPRAQQAYQPLGDLLLTFPNVDTMTVSNYRRELDMETGVSSVSYTSGGVTYKREVFVSYPDKVMVLRVSTDKKKSLNMQAGIKTFFMDKISFERGGLIADGTWRRQNIPRDAMAGLIADSNMPGLNFRIEMKALTENGSIVFSNDQLRIEGADAVTFVISAATNFVNYRDVSANPAERTEKALTAVKGKKYKDFLKAHIADFSSIMGKVHLNLNGDPQIKKLPINKRLDAIRTGGVDVDLEGLVFQFGRYALTSSSRSGGQPANLQGIWNESLLPPWGSKLTTNINVQMNYWPAEVTNLTECVQPLFDMIKDLSENGRKTAKLYYNLDKGWVTHHNTDIWRGTAPVDEARYGMWPVGGAWLALHLCEHYNYSNDLAFLQKYYPIIKGAAEFVFYLLTEHPKYGYLVTPFSMSPEKGFRYMDGNVKKTAYVSPAPTMDVGIIRELFPYVIQFSEILGIDADFRAQLKKALERLPPYKINSLGFIQEWIEDFEAVQVGHDMSENFPFFPGSTIQLRRAGDKPFIEAINRWMVGRSAGGGWPAAWNLCFWARLEQGDKTAAAITAGTRGAAYSLYRRNPNNQIDGSFGHTAGIAESLLQSHAGEISLLPALPVSWSNGTITGLRARGGYEVDIEWKDGKLFAAKIKNVNGKEAVQVRYKDRTKTVNVKQGEMYRVTEI